MTGFGYNINGFGVSGGGGTATLVTQALINSQENYNTVVASDFVGSGGTIIIPAGFWVFSTTNALTIDVDDITIENYGKIVGRARGISIGASGATINNYSGAFIAGGGGRGSQGRNGTPGYGAGSSEPNTYLNQNGPNGSGTSSGNGGGAGGGGGATTFSGTGSGGQGGWILPGSGGAGGSSGYGSGGNGGSAGNVGGNGTRGGNDGGGPLNSNGGGGGWGARGGGNGIASGGSAGNPAIFPDGNTYTLSNIGTIYGTTS